MWRSLSCLCIRVYVCVCVVKQLRLYPFGPPFVSLTLCLSAFLPLCQPMVRVCVRVCVCARGRLFSSRLSPFSFCLPVCVYILCFCLSLSVRERYVE